MTALSCPHCGNLLANDPALSDQIVICPHCQGKLQMPSAQPPIPVAAPFQPPLPAPPVQVNLNVSQFTHAASPPLPSYGSYSNAPAGITVPVLISAISNIIVSLFWISTFIGIVIAVPMVVLCVFEFRLYSRAQTVPVERLASEAVTIGIFEIAVGLFNWFALVCGIIVIVNASGTKSRSLSTTTKRPPVPNYGDNPFMD